MYKMILNISKKNDFKYSVKQHLLERFENFICNNLFCYTFSTLLRVKKL